jgi:hypothetical protein
VPLDEICRKHDSFPARALALVSILPDATDKRAAPLKPGGYERARGRIDIPLVQTAR